ncbi:MAG TPA: lamin tail domain-containing protein, partial [Verrucomicrobiae bacterium]|nr:lamin tail domain-containing protein [Verrucomicrobiae bacterium]
TITFSTLTPGSVDNASYQGTVNIPLGSLLTGDNVIAVEVHQSGSGSTDVVLGLRVDATVITNNPALSGILINEVLANNVSILEPDGSNPDWVELYNPDTSAIDLANLSLSDRIDTPRLWVFPAPSIIAGRGFFRVRLNSALPSSPTNTGFGLKASGDNLYLFNKPAAGGELLDSIAFGLQVPDLSIGRLPDGTNSWRLTLPSLGAANLAAALGDSMRLKVNEWMASPTSGDDWFEIYNPNAQAVALGGLYLTDDLNNRLKSLIPALSFIAGGLQGFQQFQADSSPANGADHANFRLSNSGESLGIATAAGVLIDGITFSNQTDNVSQGRLPDGGVAVTFFPSTPTPGESNYLPLENVVVNEALTHSDPPFEDAIELRNLTGAPVNIGGWFLTDQKTLLQKFRIPDNTMLPAHGFKVFYENQFNPVPEDPGSFALSSAKGDQIHLSSSTAGVLNGYRSVVDFGAAANGVSFGRFVNSVGTAQFVAMSNKTFGVNSPESVAEFRTGLGQTNSYPLVGPMVINQINYHPPDVGTNDNLLDEYIELLNINSAPVNLFDPANPTNHWRLRDAVSFDFTANTTIPAGGKIVIVSFDPVANPGVTAAFRAKYSIGTTPVVGPFLGKLDNGTESVELVRPDAPQTAPSADVGFVPYILVERVKYADTSPWPTDADGRGAALLRLTPRLVGNDPANWIPSTPAGELDSDNDGMPDSWEIQYGLNPGSNDAALDRDGDGFTNL